MAGAAKVPYSLDPQHCTVVPGPSAQVEETPAATWVTPESLIGQTALSVEAQPFCMSPLSPQHTTPPPFVRAQVWSLLYWRRSEAESALAPCTPGTRTGPPP